MKKLEIENLETNNGGLSCGEALGYGLGIAFVLGCLTGGMAFVPAALWATDAVAFSQCVLK